MAGQNNVGVKTHFFNSGLKNILAGATELINFGGAAIFANSITVWNNSDSLLEVEIESVLSSVGTQVVPPYSILVCSLVSDRFNELRIKQVGGTTGQFLVNSIRDNKDVSSNSGNRVVTSLTAISTNGNIDNTPPSSSNQTVIYNQTTQSIPVAFPPNTSNLFLDVTNMDSDLDITNWMPTGLVDGAIVRVRKIDNTAFKIVWNPYGFIDKQYELITFQYDLSSNILNMI